LVDKGDHIRLQDISLSYDVDGSKLNKHVFNSMQVYLYVSNLGILWRANKDGLDPDLWAGGVPSPINYSIGVKANF